MLGTLAQQVETLACSVACWHIYWNVGMPLACKACRHA